MRSPHRSVLFSVALIATSACSAFAPAQRAAADGRTTSGNPIFPGYFADPSVVIHDGRVYVYATRDPWGGETLACFSTDDFEVWDDAHPLDWPTLEACQTPESTDAKVWAPSVVKQRDDRFIMYVSVGSEIYCGVASTPTGPWKNVKADGTPVIPNRGKEHPHMIDAEVFQDDDGRNYLYWGSGWDWKNGRCLVVELEEDLYTHIGEPRDITPPGYFEAPFMVKRDGRYYLMYSDGKCVNETYKVRYAMGDSPMGPFTTEGPNSPILTTNRQNNVIGPGHHAVFTMGDRFFIAYHRLRVPLADNLLREICVDELHFADDGAIQPVTPTQQGVELSALNPTK